jgi:RNA polymerase sigma factor FliA
VSFAEHRIRGAILDELRRGDIMPRRVRQLARKVATTVRELEQSGEAANDEQVAGKLGVTVEHYRKDLAQLAHVELAPLPDEDVLVAEASQAPDAVAEHRQEIAQVRAALDRLPARDVQILGLHYIEDLTYQQIANILHITPSRVCQLLWRAIGRLRGELAPVAPVRAAA